MPPITLRPITPGDEPFLRALYAATREVELAALPPSLHDTFTNSQYDLQRAHYERAYPHAAWSVIERGGVPVGRLIVDRSGSAWVLVDIAITPVARSQGIGSALIRELLDEARRSGRSLELSVRVDNARAMELYAQLGFVRRASDGAYISMAWTGEERWA